MKINFKKILTSKTAIFSGLAGLMVLGFFGFWHYRDDVFSKEVLQLAISGPQTAAMGEEITYTVKYKNNGNFVLENPKLIFGLPDNSLTEDSRTRLTANLKDLNPGESDTITFKARLLGKEGDVKTAQAALTYVPHNLSARYESDATFDTIIQTVPLTLTFDLPAQAEKSKEVTYAVHYASDVDYPLENLSVKVDAMDGFNVESGNPASLDNVEWKLDTLQKSQNGTLQIKGITTADIGSTLHFSAHLGMWVGGTFVMLKDAIQDVPVVQPQLVISQTVNSSIGYVTFAGDLLNYQITLKNNGSAALAVGQVVSRLSGGALDISTLQVSAPAQVANGVVTFSVPDLQPQQEINLQFSVKVKDALSLVISSGNITLIKNVISANGSNQEFDTSVNTPGPPSTSANPH